LCVELGFSELGGDEFDFGSSKGGGHGLMG
jgi:hypothetical protein